jgi:hypothetical protein
LGWVGLFERVEWLGWARFSSRVLGLGLGRGAVG